MQLGCAFGPLISERTWGAIRPPSVGCGVAPQNGRHSIVPACDCKTKIRRHRTSSTARLNDEGTVAPAHPSCSAVIPSRATTLPLLRRLLEMNDRQIASASHRVATQRAPISETHGSTRARRMQGRSTIGTQIGDHSRTRTTATPCATIPRLLISWHEPFLICSPDEWSRYGMPRDVPAQRRKCCHPLVVEPTVDTIDSAVARSSRCASPLLARH